MSSEILPELAAFSKILTSRVLVVNGVMSTSEIAFTPSLPVGTLVGILAAEETSRFVKPREPLGLPVKLAGQDRAGAEQSE